jgi:Activator of Hsp90 ATPase homolog 1-like protein
VLRFELSPAGDGTELTFTARTELPEDFESKVLAGWHYHLDALAQTLEGESPDLVHLPNERWAAIAAGYAER